MLYAATSKYFDDLNFIISSSTCGDAIKISTSHNLIRSLRFLDHGLEYGGSLGALRDLG